MQGNEKNETGKVLLYENGKRPLREKTFQKNINFNQIIELYLFDKKLRLLMLDAVERIEIHLRAVIANEMGACDPLAYLNGEFINPSKMMKKKRNLWEEWKTKQNQLATAGKEKPFWVAVESWNFGALSKYYSLLKRRYQTQICQCLDIDNEKILEIWLRAINMLRNKCAHHSRIWNEAFQKLPTLEREYFNNLPLDEKALTRMYGMIGILWFLVKKIGPSSDWLKSVATLIDSKPKIDSCPFTAMGFPDNSGFPDLSVFEA